MVSNISRALLEHTVGLLYIYFLFAVGPKGRSYYPSWEI